MARTSLIPGFRFHPTDVELVMFYLKRKLLGKKITVNAIAEVNIYDFSPWDLPDKSSLKSGDLEWYFFCPKAKKYSSGSRSNRATESGFWKATGKDRNVKYNERTVATIKTLVFHLGHAGKGQRTDWVMHEYKMEDEHLAKAGIVQDMYVLCKVYEKSGSGPKNGAHYGAPFNEEEWGDDLASCSGSGLVSASNKTDNAQKGLVTMSVTEPGSSIVTFSPSMSTHKLNNKQKGPAAMKMTEPGSSIVTFSADQPTKTPDDKQKGPALMTMTEPGLSIAFSSTQPTKTPNDKQKGPAALTMTEPGSSTNTLNNNQKGPAAMTMAEPGSSIVSFFSNTSTNKLNNKQKGPAAMKMTEPGSSIVTFSADQPTKTPDDKQKGPALMTMTEPGSSIVTFSSTQPTKTPNDKQKGSAALTMTDPSSSTNTLNNKQKGPAAMTLTGPGSSIVSFSSNLPTNTLNDKQKGPSAMTITEPGSSVMFSADQPTNTLNDKQKVPAAMNMAVPQTYDDVMFFEDIDLPTDDVDMFYEDDLMFFEDDLMFFEDIDLITGPEEDEAANVEKVKSMVPNEGGGIYDDLVDLIDLEELNKIDFKTDGADYTLDRLLTLDDLDVHLGEFYVD
ncbi:hypothetical protein L1987_81080 [Smallanthus sonchifolius]|uniref:Uncharacterized protein n=1 Tax=Smallanthus sonchifolius TaxID=185202 RepID=A0ACB8YTQ3_9ASTR|nr:hypothetical protein L1987_81080 [Smallanthus sonchifolius]